MRKEKGRATFSKVSTKVSGERGQSGGFPPRLHREMRLSLDGQFSTLEMSLLHIFVYQHDVTSILLSRIVAVDRAPPDLPEGHPTVEADPWLLRVGTAGVEALGMAVGSSHVSS